MKTMVEVKEGGSEQILNILTIGKNCHGDRALYGAAIGIKLNDEIETVIDKLRLLADSLEHPNQI